MTWEPDRCALVIVDVQNDFCHQQGAFSLTGIDVACLQEVLPSIESLIGAARKADVPRIFLRTEHGPGTDDAASSRRSDWSSSIDLSRHPIALAGAWGSELYRLKPEPDEAVVTKSRHSGFAYTSLELHLRASGRDTVILAGVCTNVCVMATGIDAVAHGFFPVLIDDCTAAATPQEHESTVRDFPQYFGAVATRSELCASWEAGMCSA